MSEFNVHRHPSNTCVYRKSNSRYTIIAKVTKAFRAVMAAQMQEITNTTIT